MSRRWLLRRGMQAAAATVAAGVLWHHDTQRASAGTEHFGITVFDTSCGGPFGDFCATDQVVVEAGGDGLHPAIWAHSAGSDHYTTLSQNTGGGTAIRGETTGDNPSIDGRNFGGGPGVYGANQGIGPAIHGVGTGTNSDGVKGEGHIGVWGESTQAGTDGVFGRNTNGNGVRGTGATGVKGTSSSGTGVYGSGKNGVWGVSSTFDRGAVYGQHTGTGYGVIGDGAGGDKAGVLGRNATGDGIRGEGVTGVHGTSAATDAGAVWGQHTGTGYGVVGDGAGAAEAGVLGRNRNGHGVRGEGKTGVLGKATSSTGYGGQFQGGQAQLRLVPGSTAGAPTSGSHAKGELYLDSAGTLFVCTAAATPGTWRKVSTVAV